MRSVAARLRPTARIRWNAAMPLALRHERDDDAIDSLREYLAGFTFAPSDVIGVVTMPEDYRLRAVMEDDPDRLRFFRDIEAGVVPAADHAVVWWIYGNVVASVRLAELVGRGSPEFVDELFRGPAAAFFETLKIGGRWWIMIGISRARNHALYDHFAAQGWPGWDMQYDWCLDALATEYVMEREGASAADWLALLKRYADQAYLAGARRVYPRTHELAEALPRSIT